MNEASLKLLRTTRRKSTHSLNADSVTLGLLCVEHMALILAPSNIDPYAQKSLTVVAESGLLRRSPGTCILTLSQIQPRLVRMSLLPGGGKDPDGLLRTPESDGL